METIQQNDLTQAITVVSNSSLAQLADCELALVGGGIGDTIGH